MPIDERDYMSERYRRRGGPKSLPVWRDDRARIEYDEADMVASRYARRNWRGEASQYAKRMRASRDGRLRTPPIMGPGGRLLPALVLSATTLAYVVIAQPFGDLIDLTGLPKNGEFRVRNEYHDAPTGMIAITSPGQPLALHLVDPKGKQVFVGFVRGGKVAELMVPEGSWHAVVTSGTAHSLITMTDLKLGKPLGVIKVKAGERISLKTVDQGKAEREGI